MIEKFNLFINESKQAGVLYHCTNLSSAIKIIEEDIINGSHFGYEENEILGISTSRNKLFIYDNNPIQFVLDGDKISENYKIIPTDYWKREYNIPNEPQIKDEDEELIIVPKEKLSFASKYIIKVNIYSKYLREDPEELIKLLTNKNIDFRII